MDFYAFNDGIYTESNIQFVDVELVNRKHLKQLDVWISFNKFRIGEDQI